MDNKRMRYEKGKGSDLKVIKDRGDALRKKIIVSKEFGNKATSVVFGKTLRDRGDTDKPIKIGIDKTDELKNKITIDPEPVNQKTEIKCDSDGNKIKNKPFAENFGNLPYKENVSLAKINKNTKDSFNKANGKEGVPPIKMTKDKQNINNVRNPNRKQDNTSAKNTRDTKNSNSIINQNSKEDSSPVKIAKDTKVTILTNQIKKEDASTIKTSKDIKDSRFVSKIGRLTSKVQQRSESDPKNKSDEKLDSSKTDKESSSKENTAQRKSIIKTIQGSDSTKTYKGVTFTDQKRSPTSLQINIPTHPITVKKTRIPKLINALQTKLKPAKSTTSVKEKPVLNRKNRTERRNKRLQNRSPASPHSVAKDGGSPQTEVAKWAPNSINKHTKPYYEAWVNTTLAAISKRSKFDKLFLEKQNIIQNFEMALEQRSDSPELVYENFADERYTGKIKVNHKSNKKVRH